MLPFWELRMILHGLHSPTGYSGFEESYSGIHFLNSNSWFWLIRKLAFLPFKQKHAAQTFSLHLKWSMLYFNTFKSSIQFHLKVAYNNQWHTNTLLYHTIQENVIAMGHSSTILHIHSHYIADCRGDQTFVLNSPCKLHVELTVTCEQICKQPAVYLFAQDASLTPLTVWNVMAMRL